jgi:Tol biopolymer transport system component
MSQRLPLLLLMCLASTTARADVPRAIAQLMSHHASANQTGDGQSDNGLGISDDGRFVVYRSAATDLVAGVTDDNAAADVFVYDRRTDRNELVSRRYDDAQRTASGASFPLALSGDGRYVLFYSEAPDVVAMTDANGGGSAGRDLFLRDRETGTVRLLTRKGGAPTLTSANAGQAYSTVMTRDGAFVAFMTAATDIVPGIANPMSRAQIYVYSRAGDSIQMLTTQAGNAAVASNSLNPFVHDVSDDGEWWLFLSDGSDLVGGGVSSPIGWQNLFLFNRAGTTRLLLSRLAANPNSGCMAHVRRADMNADATRIVFGSECTTHVTGVTDANATEDVFRFDRPSDVITLVSHAQGNLLQTANGRSEFPKLTRNGDVLFRSTASDLVAPGVDANGAIDVYLRSAAGAIELVSVNAGGASAGNGASFAGLDPVSDDGRFVTWSSDATDLDAEVIDDNATRDVFVRDRVRGRTELVSVRSTLPLHSAGGFSGLGTALTPDGTSFVFGSFGADLSATHADGNGVADAFVAEWSRLFGDGFE